MLIIDKYAYTNKLRDLNPISKVYIGITLLMLSISTKLSFLHLGIVLAIAFGLVVIAKIPFKRYIKLLLIPLSFLLLSVMAVVISISSGDIEYILGIELFSFKIVITEAGLQAARVLFFRAFAALSSSYFIVLTTPMDQLIYVLNKHKIPKLFIEMSVLIYRFIFIFLQESKEIYNAQELRFGYINLKNSYNSLSALIVALFTRIMIRYEEMEIALASKNFDREFYV